MGNMEYRRFQNTLSDLRDCYNSMSESPDELSNEEKLARQKIIALCKKIVEDHGDEV